MGKVKDWVARVFGAITASTQEQVEIQSRLSETGPPINLTIYPYNKPVDWNSYLMAWRDAMTTDLGPRLAGMLSQNYSRELMSRCPQEADTFEKKALWQAAHDARLEVWGSLLTAATMNTALSRVHGTGKTVPAP